MTNLLTVLPNFDIRPYAHILPSLEKALVSTADLLTVDAVDVAKRAQIPPGELRKLVDSLLDRLGAEEDACPAEGNNTGRLKKAAGSSVRIRNGLSLISSHWAISTLDDSLDAALKGGIHPGYLTEITGESAVGKTQFLLTLLLSAQLKPGISALYISTEAQLQTGRLTQILNTHPKLAELDPDQQPCLSRIHSTHIHDLEAQDHILRYQVPVAIERHNVGLVIIDSVAANYRAEFDKGQAKTGAQSLAKRSLQIAQLGGLLRDLARSHGVAVVTANQVADRFEPQSHVLPLTQSTQRSRPPSPHNKVAPAFDKSLAPLPADSRPAHSLATDDPLAIDHQQRFFTGWGDKPLANNMKTPSLGLTWTNQLATRITLLKEPVYEEKAYAPGEDKSISGWNRTLKVVFSAWCIDSEIGFEIWAGGVRSVVEPAVS